jgi:YegS/Rv2252/BmrU family lipid kinase
MPALGVLAHEGKQLGSGLGELRRALASAGFADVPWRQVERSKKAPEQVAELLAEGVDRLLVWGGDGTVRRCVDTIVREEAEVELAVLPAGTANLLAKGLGIPIDLEAALDIALHGRSRRIDVGQMNGESFVVMAGTGFDALMIRDADDGKDRWGRLAYLRAGARHLAADGALVSVDVDGRPWFEGRAACVLVGNLGRVLGGLEVFPAAEADDGQLDIGVLAASSRRDWVRVAARAVTGRIDASPMVEITRGTKVKFRLDHTMPWELDGGDRPKAKKFKVHVLPQRLAVRVPVAS